VDPATDAPGHEVLRRDERFAGAVQLALDAASAAGGRRISQGELAARAAPMAGMSPPMMANVLSGYLPHVASERRRLALVVAEQLAMMAEESGASFSVDPFLGSVADASEELGIETEERRRGGLAGAVARSRAVARDRGVLSVGSVATDVGPEVRQVLTTFLRDGSYADASARIAAEDPDLADQ
jgi:hypothetical protein